MIGRKLEHKLNKLLGDTQEAWYWVGFLLADGHISEINRLSFTLSHKDKEQVHRFADFIELDHMHIRKNDYEYESYTVSLMDKKIVQKLRNKFDFKYRKTYNPPIKEHRLDKLMIALYIGFIDGDGSIKKQHNRPDCSLVIKAHISWETFIIKLRDDLYRYFNAEVMFGNKCSTVNNEGYANITITNNTLLKRIKGYVNKYNLPVLERKWDKIDLEYVTFYEKAKIRHKRIDRLKLLGFSIRDIADKLDTKYSTVYMYLRRKGGSNRE